jgi:hypothetical protein
VKLLERLSDTSHPRQRSKPRSPESPAAGVARHPCFKVVYPRSVATVDVARPPRI